MDLQTLQPLFHWLAEHPGWAGVFVFLIALTESLLVVGLIVPGTVLMFGVGALLGIGVLGLWETLAWAVAGAVAGDGISFWLGYHFRERIAGWWPFRKRPELLSKGQAFFRRHGGKSVLFGRFVGPVRPMIPAVAGMMQMPPWRFVVVNVASALVWAPAYLLPGLAFGASLELAAEVAGRLAVLLLGMLVLVVLVIWLVRRLVRWLTPWASYLTDRLLAWGWSHPYLGRITAWVMDPAQPEAKGLVLWAALLLILASVLLGLVSLAGEAALPLDVSVYNFLHDLHTPWANTWFSGILLWADPLPLLGLAAVLLLVLLARRQWSTAWHLAVTVLFAVLVIALLGELRPARPPLVHPALLGGGFPAWHVLGPLTLFGFVAIVAGGMLRAAWRWLPYALAAVLVTLFSVAALYLGVNWLSDVVTAWVLGLAWVAVVGVAYRRRPHRPTRLALLLPVGLLAYGGLGLTHLAEQPRLLQQMTREIPPAQWTSMAWQQTGWAELEPYRRDLRGLRKQPLNVQWRGELGQIRVALEGRGWRAPPALNWVNALRWFSARPSLAELPLLPNVHQGRHEALVLVKPAGENHQWLLRLWPVPVRVDGEPLWQGYVARQVLRQQFEYFWLPQLSPDFQAPLEELARDVTSWPRQRVRWQTLRDEALRWPGEVLLIGGEKP